MSSNAPSASTEITEADGLPVTGADELARGTVVGRYVLLDRLGTGGMGVVYAAYDPELDRKLALKLVTPRADRTHKDRARLLREAQALAKLSNPHVVAIHDVGTHGERVWLAMELVEGSTLAEWARAEPRRWSELLPVLTDVARGVAAAHAVELVHRDLKPDNVMVGEDRRVRVMDFGLAHGRAPVTSDTEPGTPLDGPPSRPTLAALAMRLTNDGAIQGTPAYMAPEQWKGNEAGAEADQFGWSVMAWELLYGERPFAGETPSQIATSVLLGRRRPPPSSRRVPAWLRRIVERGLELEPSRRWPTMVVLVSALERGGMRARRRTLAMGLVGVTAVAVVAVVGERWDHARQVAACEQQGAAIDEVWNDDARARLRAAFEASGVSFAATTVDKALPWLDERAREWRHARTEVCMNAEVRGAWSEQTLERAVWCLEDLRVTMAALVAALGRGHASGAPGKSRGPACRACSA